MSDKQESIGLLAAMAAWERGEIFHADRLVYATGFDTGFTAGQKATNAELLEALEEANEQTKLYPGHPGQYAELIAKAREQQ